MIVNTSAPLGPVVPVLIYADVPKAINWLSKAFGFTERLRTPPEPDGTIHHAQIAIGEGSAMLNGHPLGPNGRLASMFVPVGDVDAHYEHAKQFGAKILGPPATHPFGERQYSAEDPEGHRWTFSQSVADVNPQAWGAEVSQIARPPRIPLKPSFCYLEIPATDAHQSANFYETVFGWNIRHRETDRPSFDDASGHISGAWATGRTPCKDPGLLPYIWVDSVEATLARIAQHGGVVVEPPRPDHPGGSCFIATFRDPAGNVLGLYQE